MSAHSEIHAAYAHLIDDGITNRVKAQRHLIEMTAARRAYLEAEFEDAGQAALAIVSEPISAEIKVRAAAEWAEARHQHSKDTAHGR